MQIREEPFVKIPDIDRTLPWKPKLTYELKDIEECAKSSGRKAIDVRKYLWERKRDQIVKSKIVKFVEAFWRFLFYSCFCILGYNALFVPEPAPWLFNTVHHFEGWPHHVISNAMFFYYHIELGCYIHQLLWTEVSRSDAIEMIVHHIVTISLIVLSFLSKFMRIGAVILLIHDLADVFLESAKVFNYISKPEGNRWIKDVLVDPLFGVFAVTFFITRLVIYPRNILRSLFVDGYLMYGCDWGGCPAYIGLLFMLQFLHIFWFYLIMRMVVKLAMGTMKDDERSDNEEELEDHPDADTKKDHEDKKKK